MDLTIGLDALPTQCRKGKKVPKQNTFQGSTLLLLDATDVSTVLPLKQGSYLRFI